MSITGQQPFPYKLIFSSKNSHNNITIPLRIHTVSSTLFDPCNLQEG